MGILELIEQSSVHLGYEILALGRVEIGEQFAFEAVETGLHIDQAAADVIHTAVEMGDLSALCVEGDFHLAEIRVEGVENGGERLVHSVEAIVHVVA